MPRRRKRDQWLPPRVYRGKSKFEYHPKEGGSINVCELTKNEAEVWQAYYQIIGKGIISLADLKQKFYNSNKYLERKDNTKKLWNYCWKRLDIAFGRMDISKVTRRHVMEYMEIRSDKAPVAANRELAFLDRLYKFAAAKCYLEPDQNPCIGIERNTEKARNYYIEDEEYYALLEASSPMMQVFMELAYICAARGQDIRKIMLSDLKDNGLLITQAKTGKKQIKLWNDRLRGVINQALAIRAEKVKRLSADPIWLIITNRGMPYTEAGLKAVWRRNREEAAKKLGREFKFTFHDLKAKGISDYEGDKQEFSGHKSRSMMERYNRTPDAVPVIGKRK